MGNVSSRFVALSHNEQTTPMPKSSSSYLKRFVELEALSSIHSETVLEMEMDSHGGLKVTIRQTEWKKKTTQQLRCTDL